MPARVSSFMISSRILQILVQLLGVVALGIPLGFPIGDDAQPESDRIDFSSH